MENNPTAVLDIVTGVVEDTENNDCNHNKPLETLKCRFDYPFSINDRGMCMRLRECILEHNKEGHPTFEYELCMDSILNER